MWSFIVPQALAPSCKCKHIFVGAITYMIYSSQLIASDLNMDQEICIACILRLLWLAERYIPRGKTGKWRKQCLQPWISHLELSEHSAKDSARLRTSSCPQRGQEDVICHWDNWLMRKKWRERGKRSWNECANQFHSFWASFEAKTKSKRAGTKETGETNEHETNTNAQPHNYKIILYTIRVFAETL